MTYHRQQLDLPILDGLTLSEKIGLLASLGSLIKDLFTSDPIKRAERQKRREVRRAEKTDRKFRKEMEDKRHEYREWLKDEEITDEQYDKFMADLETGTVWQINPQ